MNSKLSYHAQPEVFCTSFCLNCPGVDDLSNQTLDMPLLVRLGSVLMRAQPDFTATNEPNLCSIVRCSLIDLCSNNVRVTSQQKAYSEHRVVQLVRHLQHKLFLWDPHKARFCSSFHFGGAAAVRTST